MSGICLILPPVLKQKIVSGVCLCGRRNIERDSGSSRNLSCPVRFKGFGGRHFAQLPFFVKEFFPCQSPVFRGCVHRGFGNKFRFVEHGVRALVQKLKNCFTVCKADFHLGGMDIDIDVFGAHGQMKDRKREAVLHEIGAISFFKTGGEFFAAKHPAVDEEGLKTAA